MKIFILTVFAVVVIAFLTVALFIATEKRNITLRTDEVLNLTKLGIKVGYTCGTDNKSLEECLDKVKDE